MDYVPVPHTVQLEMIFSWSSQVIENVFHYSTTTSPLLLDMAGLADFARLAWSNAIRALIAPTVSLNNIKITDLESQTGFVFQTSTNLPMAGASASPSLPNNVALVVTKRTALRGRSYRGRWYVGGLTEAVVTDNTPTGAFVTAAIAWGTGALSYNSGGLVYNMCVVSRHNAGVPRVTGVATPVTGFTCDPILDSQRRRLPGRGK